MSQEVNVEVAISATWVREGMHRAAHAWKTAWGHARGAKCIRIGAQGQHRPGRICGSMIYV